MFDELLEIFERKSSPHGKRQGGVRGMLNRLTGKDESHYADDRSRRARYGDDDDDDRSRRRREDDADRYDARRREDDDRSYARRRDDDDDHYPRRRKRREMGDLFDFE